MLNLSSCDSIFTKCCLPITQLSSTHCNYSRFVARMGAKKAIRDSSDTLWRDLVNCCCHVRHGYLASVHKDLEQIDQLIMNATQLFCPT